MQRRNFLKIGGLAIGGLAIPRGLLKAAQSFPASERLGRVNLARVRLKSAPDENSQTLDFLYEDAVVPWLREVVGPQPFRINQRWVETPNGFIWAPHLQPVENKEK